MTNQLTEEKLQEVYEQYFITKVWVDVQDNVATVHDGRKTLLEIKDDDREAIMDFLARIVEAGWDFSYTLEFESVEEGDAYFNQALVL